VLKGDAKCTRCHDAGRRLPGARHRQDQARHASPTAARRLHQLPRRERDATSTSRPTAKERPRPDAHVHTTSPTPIAQRNGACMSCHRRDAARSHWEGSQHQNAEVACTSCHPDPCPARQGAREAHAARGVLHLPQGAARDAQPALAPPDSRGQGGCAPIATTRTAPWDRSWSSAIASTTPATPATWRSAARSCTTTSR
jgi:hypothetical protein